MLFVARGAAAVAGLLVCLPLHYLSRLAGRPSAWPRRFLAWVGRSAGMRPHIVGKPLGDHVLFLANHLSWLDIVLIAGATGAAFVSKEEVARWPVIGWLARLNHSVFVARSERRAVQGQADALRNALQGRRPVALFPEGTTSDGSGVFPFRASLIAALYPPVPGLKVQPIAIDYGAATRDLAWVDGESVLANARRVLSRPRPTPVALHFLPPLDPAAFPGRKALAEAARAQIVEALAASAARRDRL